MGQVSDDVFFSLLKKPWTWKCVHHLQQREHTRSEALRSNTDGPSSSASALIKASDP